MAKLTPAQKRDRKRRKTWGVSARTYFGWFFSKGDKITGEDVRLTIGPMLDKPKSSNTWGGFIQGLVTRGYLKDTGKTRPMKAERSHGRRTPVYVVKKNT